MQLETDEHYADDVSKCWSFLVNGEPFTVVLYLASGRSFLYYLHKVKHIMKLWYTFSHKLKQANLLLEVRSAIHHWI